MQIVINIPDDQYEIILRSDETWAASCASKEAMMYAIKTGTQLPKGHGKLIDANKFLKDNEAYTGWILNSSDWGGENAYKDTLEDLVNEAPTVVEADMEE